MNKNALKLLGAFALIALVFGVGYLLDQPDNVVGDKIAGFLAIVFGIGGVLMLPFNSVIIGAFVSLFLGVKHEVWMEAAKRLWVLQILWNLLFLGIGVSIKHAEGPTYTLTRIDRPLSPETRSEILKEEREGWASERDKHYLHDKVWEYQETTKSKEMSPFQRGLNASNWTQLPSPVYDSHKEIAGLCGSELADKLNTFSEEEDARKFIADYNACYDGTWFTNLLMVPVGAVALVFYIMLCEAIVIALITFCVGHPILAGVLFGPSLWKIFKASRS